MPIRLLMIPFTAFLFVASSFMLVHAQANKSTNMSAATVHLDVKMGSAKDIESTRRALDTWLNAINIGNSSVVTTLYTTDAVLLPTLDGAVLFTPASRKKYFDSFTANLNLKGTITELNIQCAGSICVASGLYTFNMGKDVNAMRSIPARFTYVFEKKGEKWMIIHHHSSSLPSPI